MEGGGRRKRKQVVGDNFSDGGDNFEAGGTVGGNRVPAFLLDFLKSEKKNHFSS